jgi:hypothetical protein
VLHKLVLDSKIVRLSLQEHRSEHDKLLLKVLLISCCFTNHAACQVGAKLVLDLVVVQPGKEGGPGVNVHITSNSTSSFLGLHYHIATSITL